MHASGLFERRPERTGLTSLPVSAAERREIEWTAPAFNAVQHQTRLFDVTGGVVAAIGETGSMSGASNTYNRSSGCARVSIAGSRTFRIEHQCSGGAALFGQAGNFGTEVYTRVMVRRA